MPFHLTKILFLEPISWNEFISPATNAFYKNFKWIETEITSKWFVNTATLPSLRSAF